MELSARGTSFTNPYPATAARALNALQPLRQLEQVCTGPTNCRLLAPQRPSLTRSRYGGAPLVPRSRTELIAQDARMVVNAFLRLMPDESVALVADDAHHAEATALADAIGQMGSPLTRIDATATVERVCSQRHRLLDRPPDQLVETCQASSVTVFIVDETYAFRLDHQVGRLFQTGPDCSIFKIDFGMGTWGLTDNDVRRVVRIGERLTAAINGHDRVRITSRRGTDFTLSIAGRECLPIYPVPDRGAPYGLSVPLWGDSDWAPIEDSAHGRIVIDGLTEAVYMAAVSEPVMMSIEGGRVVDVTGSRDAEDFQRLFKTDAGAAVVGSWEWAATPKLSPATKARRPYLARCISASDETTSTPVDKTTAPSTSTASFATSH